MLRVLERVQQTDEPWRFSSSENIALDEDVSDLMNPLAACLKRCEKAYLVHFMQGTFPHLLQRADFAGLLLSSQEHFAITTLSNLRDNMELIDFELCPTPAQEDSFAPTVGLELFGIFRRLKLTGGGIFVKIYASFLAICEVSKGLKVVVEKI